MINEELLKELKNKVLVFDIETSSVYSDNTPINISNDFESYIQHAKCKFFGAYSYLHNKYYNLKVSDNVEEIIDLLEEHDILVSFNGETFDFPILVNNGLVPMEKKGINYRTGDSYERPKRFLQVDMMLILGNKNFQTEKEVSFKARGSLMGYNFKKNSLKHMAEIMKLDVQKGDIDYNVFFKDFWSDDELKDIYKYLQADVEVTKQMFEKTWDFWLPFTEWITEDNVKNLSFIRASIASLTYKSACNTLGCEETYSDISEDSNLDTIGAYVMQPKYEEVYNALSCDFSGLYPHAYAMFNLFNEVPEEDVERLRSEGRIIWHGNDIFEVKGYYDITEWHTLSKNVAERLKERIYLKYNDSDNPKIYALKIFLNCFSPDTQVMTPEGVKNITDFKIGDKCYSMNKETKDVEVANVVAVQNYPYDGVYNHIKVRNHLDLMVTDEHNMIVQNKKDNITKFIKANRFYDRRWDIPMHNPLKKGMKNSIYLLDYVDFNNYDFFIFKNGLDLRTLKIRLKEYDIEFIKRHGKYCGIITDEKIIKILCDLGYDVRARAKRSPITSWNKLVVDNKIFSRFLGYFIADGSFYESKLKKYETSTRGVSKKISVAKYTKSKGRNNLYENMSKLGVQKLHMLETEISFSSDMWFEIFSKVGKSYDKHIPDFLWDDIDREECFHGMYEFDGTTRSNLYSSVSKKLKEQLKIILFEMGHRYSERFDSGCYRIGCTKIKKKCVEPYNIKKVQTDFNSTHCITLDKNNTIYAGRNNSFTWTGQSLYGSQRSPIFEKIHTPNGGADCCRISQSMIRFAKTFMEDKGFEVVYIDTDSLYMRMQDGSVPDKDYTNKCLEEMKKIILDNVPFPVDTFGMMIENHIPYLMFPFHEQPIQDEEGNNIKNGNRLVKERKGVKKNYVYIYEKDGERKVKVMGCQIIKDGATELSKKIFSNILEPLILKRNRAKFTRKEMDYILEKVLKQENSLKLLGREFKVKPFHTYKNPSQLQASISKYFFGNQGGQIFLIKNKKVGCGKGSKYATYEMIKDAGLTIKDMDLTKLNNELDVFVEYEGDEE